ncbi:F-box protein At3g07870-like [Papaver somniferum]|uniref:F-box protein At3g07870-like n=1 Tax=Papaver somniferum TaxID=3469 RepID=UPI000E702A90|nr:F-box protein At3g07870-like [Papaver somniferum]
MTPPMISVIQYTSAIPSLVGSCNGLVCVNDTRNHICDPIYICNPISGEYVNLPRLHEKPYDPFDHTVSGFAYHQSTHEYKVVRIFYYRALGVQVDVQVYTLGDKQGWRNKQVSTRYHLVNSSGIFVYGALHWKDYSKKQVVAFDLGTEEFQTLPSPPCVSIGWGIQVLRGYLCAVDIQPDNNCVDIWGFKNSGTEPNHPRSWSKEFNIEVNDSEGDMRYRWAWPLHLLKTMRFYCGTMEKLCLFTTQKLKF